MNSLDIIRNNDSISKKPPQQKIFSYTGGVQTFVVPSGVTSIKVDCRGAGGNRASASAAKGGRVQCDLKVTPGQTLYILVGGKGGFSTSANTGAGGYNGGGIAYTGGNNHVCGGSGASDIRTSSGDLNSRLIVAGGAGGGISSFSGGLGGGTTGGAGSNSGGGNTPGGGTQSGGGSGGNAGSFGTGGSTVALVSARGAGGGGGYYGGGAWFTTSNQGGAIGQGGGGSSYTNSSYCTNVLHTQGFTEAIDVGKVIFDY